MPGMAAVIQTSFKPDGGDERDRELAELVAEKERQRLQAAFLAELRCALPDATCALSELRTHGFQSMAQTLEAGSSGSAVSIAALCGALDEVGDDILGAVLKTLRRETVLVPEGAVLSEAPTVAALESETIQALNLLQGLCLLHVESKVAAGGQGVVQLIVRKLSLGSERLTTYCLDVLITVQIGSSIDQQDFLHLGGLDHVAGLLASVDNSMAMRCKAAEFLSLLLSTVLDTCDEAREAEDITPSVAKAARTKLEGQLGPGIAEALCRKVDLSDFDAGKQQLVQLVAEVVFEVENALQGAS